MALTARACHYAVRRAEARGAVDEPVSHRTRQPPVPRPLRRIRSRSAAAGHRATPPRERADSSAFRSASSPAIAPWASGCRPRTRRSSSAPGPPSRGGGREGRTSPSFSAPSASSTARSLISALVVNRDGTIAGFQDKVQLDPSEEGTYSPGSGRRVFQAGPLTFGIAICHEGWRYPETVRWAARRGAHVVFHPHFHEAEPGGYRPRPSPIRRTRSTRRRPCAAPPRTPAISPPSTTRAPARRRRRRSSGPTGRCSATSPTARKGC